MGSIGAQQNRGGVTESSFSSRGTYNFDGQEAPTGLKTWNSMWGKDEVTNNFNFLGTDYSVQNNMGGTYGNEVIGHTFVPIVNDIERDSDKGSFFMDSNEGRLYHDASQYLNEQDERRRNR